MSQTEEKRHTLVLSRSYQWMEFCVFIVIILFRTNSCKENLDENVFRYCYGDFFSKITFRKLLDHKVKVKVPSQQ